MDPPFSYLISTIHLKNKTLKPFLSITSCSRPPTHPLRNPFFPFYFFYFIFFISHSLTLHQSQPSLRPQFSLFLFFFSIFFLLFSILFSFFLYLTIPMPTLSNDHLTANNNSSMTADRKPTIISFPLSFYLFLLWKKK